MAAVYEPRAGLLFVERCVQAHLDEAQRHGAVLRLEEKAGQWEPLMDGVRVRTEKGEYQGGKLILAAGPWLKKLLPAQTGELQVERQTQFWFEPRRNPEFFRPESCPVYLVQPGAGEFFYGFPDVGTGVKVARHHQGSSVDPDRVSREVSEEETAAMRELLERFLPAANGGLRECSVCLYTNTPDEHFWIDAHPEFSQVFIASPCSGHGFKFSSVIGELAGQWAADEAPGFDLSLFRNREEILSRSK
jgi:sarcosine oxidase